MNPIDWARAWLLRTAGRVLLAAMDRWVTWRQRQRPETPADLADWLYCTWGAPYGPDQVAGLMTRPVITAHQRELVRRVLQDHGLPAGPGSVDDLCVRWWRAACWDHAARDPIVLAALQQPGHDRSHRP